MECQTFASCKRQGSPVQCAQSPPGERMQTMQERQVVQHCAVLCIAACAEVLVARKPGRRRRYHFASGTSGGGLSQFFGVNGTALRRARGARPQDKERVTRHRWDALCQASRHGGVHGVKRL